MFIQAFGDDARQQFLISVSNVAVSCFAPFEYNKGGNFVPSTFFFFFSYPVVFTAIVFLPV